MVRDADPRFAGLTIDVVNRMIIIGGTAKRSSDPWDLAQRLRDVPGITRVVIGQIEMK